MTDHPKDLHTEPDAEDSRREAGDDARRRDMRRSQVRQTVTRGSTLGVGVLLALALLVMVNYFGWKYHARWDWTSEQLYTLSEKSENVVQELTQPVDIVVFLTPASQLYDPMRELLARYEAASPLVSVRFTDPVRDSLEFQQLVDRFELVELSVVVVLKDAEGGTVDTRIIPESELAEFDFSGFQMGAAPTLDAFKGEQEVTRAILELTQGRRPRVLFTTGHGERSLDDPGPQGLATAAQLLERDNLEVEEWASLGQPAVPAGADLVVVAGPTSPFLPPELEVLDAFLEDGGRLLVMTDPVFDEGTGDGGLRDLGLGPWLARRGVQLGDDMVVDPANSVPFYGAQTIFVDSFGSHPITRSLAQARVPVVMSLARSVGLLEDQAPGDAAELLTTSAEGWGERDLADLTIEVVQGEGDLAGPVSLAVVVEGEDEPEAGEAEAGDSEGSPVEESSEAADGYRLVVTGDSDFATNQMVSNLGNQVLVTDLFNWLVEQEAALGIPAKAPQQVSLSLTREQLVWIWVYVLLLLPLSAVVLGVWIYFRRRR